LLSYIILCNLNSLFVKESTSEYLDWPDRRRHTRLSTCEIAGIRDGKRFRSGIPLRGERHEADGGKRREGGPPALLVCRRHGVPTGYIPLYRWLRGGVPEMTASLGEIHLLDYLRI
jgi:hypothetical protein